MQKLAWLQRPGAGLEGLRIHWGDRQALRMRAGQKLCNGYERAFSVTRNVEKMSTGFATFQWFDDKYSLVEVEATVNDLLHTPSFSPTETLDHLQKVFQWKFEKDHMAFSGTEKKMWNSILSRCEELIDKKDCKKGRARYTSRP